MSKLKIDGELEKELSRLQDEQKKLLQKGYDLFNSILKKYSLTDLMFTSSMEYDDNNYFEYLRPSSLLGAPFDNVELESIKVEEFVRLVKYIKKNNHENIALYEEEILKNFPGEIEREITNLLALAKAVVDHKLDAEQIFIGLNMVNKLDPILVPSEIIVNDY